MELDRFDVDDIARLMKLLDDGFWHGVTFRGEVTIAQQELTLVIAPKATEDTHQITEIKTL